ncbi:MAG TPA: hypothetical protein VFA98_10025, partial [Thermoanaerobaculia bacterium]|nr:hypothetical protein [Thermoanaerobaculia bacterium]
DWIVERKDDHLAITAGRRLEAWPSSETTFFFRDAVREVRFVVGPGGAVTGMEIDEKVGPKEIARRIP